MGVKTWIDAWPVYRQLRTMDPLGRGAAAKSSRSSHLAARTGTADQVVKSICPYCAVGCAQRTLCEGREASARSSASADDSTASDPPPRRRAPRKAESMRLAVAGSSSPRPDSGS